MTDYRDINRPHLEHEQRYGQPNQRKGVGGIIAAIVVIGVAILGLSLLSGTSNRTASTPSGAETQTAPSATTDEAQPVSPTPQTQPAPTD
ncbi:hypothetical protein ACFQ14_16885 [Pseudahrensia aquimaris]|uniref:Uncharacterized protein n=1 Tax=Pseudahrensia aquimaris TaxID=744461 RepID=A0ABW3FHX6_9HYPH